ncbi:UDP-N-acetylglucosamine 2-epimerase (non-hydrolyzing) [Brachybacterium endophyticum]|uniref:UDP-N-acetylglucosamine 2-epimerase (Non-hydrolyzing) n=1 Tax=Brachybacterium endophyticum TaxID=2182385 RepID=A0A2U2RGI8_9MICO|nr:UDP-N-acetylglucosamine 2-epimerase (non-hydrolyzing) [Brachybacterium endophyticum]PWH04983.1 UDP-N-acetylglucosamine 2-epimerase (non-hydrolyzing) [Brachybacterium endophyticum]
MKILSVVGARPQFVKLAAVADAAAQYEDVEHVIVHTGQHYDAAMSDVFFADLRIPAPDVNLGAGSGSHGRQTGAMLTALDEVLETHRPDWVLVYGDTNSTLAGTLAAVKMHVKVAHLEAGLRSFNRRMPEEHNRVLTDHAADLLLAPTEVARGHLADEGLETRTLVVGDVMTDVCLRVADAVADRTPMLPAGIDPAEDYAVATIHRADNTDDPERLAALLASLQQAPLPVALFAHPRLVAKAQEAGITLERGSVHVGDPLAYPDLVAAVRRSRAVVTDSGGLQKEAYLLGAPCVTVRTETEWVETLADGWNQLVPDPSGIAAALERPRPIARRSEHYGDGHASERVIDALRERSR